MFNYYKRLLWIWMIGECLQQSNAKAENLASHLLTALPSLDSPQFQRNFLTDVISQLDLAISTCLDNHLRVLQRNPLYTEYTQQIENIVQNKVIEKNYDVHNYKAIDEKIVLVKQLLDVGTTEAQAENVYTIRNTKFLMKLRLNLVELQAQSELELYELKTYKMCQQFIEHKKPQPSQDRPSLWDHIQLAPLASDRLTSNKTNSEAQPVPRPHFISLQHFGATIYERIKQVGSEIIDDCLRVLSQLLIEVIGETNQSADSSSSLSQLLQEIDTIMKVEDFAAKRDRLYNYLQTSLAKEDGDYKNLQAGQQDLGDLLLKMQQRGMDLFFHLLFSNFEFLEHLHAEWTKVMETFKDDGEDSKDLLEVRAISKQYTDFKQHSDDPRKHEVFLLSAENLQERTKSLPGSGGKIYEILYSAAQNVGATTLSMIKSKCSQL